MVSVLLIMNVIGFDECLRPCSICATSTHGAKKQSPVQRFGDEWLSMERGTAHGRTHWFRPSHGLTSSNPPWTKEEDWPPKNLLIKWRSHDVCGFNLSTVCLL
jgi:hypothetical protein